jgi:glycosyltransferase involved in cell wall biosynthesis
MRILFLTQVFPYPLDAGPKVRIYYVLRYLSQYHQVTLLSFVRNAQEEELAKHLMSFCEGVFTIPLLRSRGRDVWHLSRSLVNGQPFLIARDEIPAMSAKVQKLLNTCEFQAVHADQLAMAQYAVNQRGVSKTLDEHNAVWTIVQRMWQHQKPGVRRWLQALEWHKLRRYETKVIREFDHIITVTGEDQRALQPNTDSRPPITIIPICIDTEVIEPVDARTTAKHIICVGGMFYPPNVDGVLWFAREVFPIVKRENAETEFFIVGARPDPRILRLAQDDPRIRVTGYVEDTTPFLRESAVFIVPLRAGGGMRVKILDAWARGVPIVSTTIGCEGISTKAEENILVADSPDAFAQAVSRILRDRSLGRYLAENGRQWVAAHYDWRTAYRKLDEIYAR